VFLIKLSILNEVDIRSSFLFWIPLLS